MHEIMWCQLIGLDGQSRSENGRPRQAPNFLDTTMIQGSDGLFTEQQNTRAHRNNPFVDVFAKYPLGESVRLKETNLDDGNAFGGTEGSAGWLQI